MSHIRKFIVYNAGSFYYSGTSGTRQLHDNTFIVVHPLLFCRIRFDLVVPSSKIWFNVMCVRPGLGHIRALDNI